MAKKWPEIKLYKLINPEKYVGDPTKIEMRSSWEMKFAHYCDVNPSIIKWNSEGVKVPYWSHSDQKQRTYHVDFIIVVKGINGELRTMMIEIKPYSQTIKPVKKKGKKIESFINEMKTYEVNMDKWMHAAQYAKERGWEFIIMTEEQLYGTNVRNKK